MCSRPRSVSDEDILAAAQVVLGRLGPERLTLAAVAREVGLVAGTLVQRFGSKRGLLLALACAHADGLAAELVALRAAAGGPLSALAGLPALFTRDLAGPESLANHLAFLQLDLLDPDFGREARRHAEVLQQGIAQWLAEAGASGAVSLPQGGAEPLARAVHVALNGSLVLWAMHGTGAAADWVRQDVDTVLAPYRKPAAARE